MKGTALLQSVSWLQLSLALHAALGFALYAAAPQWTHAAAWDAHTYQVTLPPEELDDFTTDESGALAAAEEETLCVERDEPAPEEGVYDGPPEHQHRWTRTATSPVCTICGKPTSWTAR
ncbi:MAG: hypothetical protein ACYTGX_08920, partial [Planctomycetota bacterium]